MKHKNVAVFIPHLGCPNQCSFCNQRIISGVVKETTIEEVTDILKQAYKQITDKSTTEIAFFGGSFTAINREYMLALLQSAQPFLGENGFRGIRISTRPDAISAEILDILKCYRVTAIELGAQSMNDEVLAKNLRGHTAKQVKQASKLIHEYGFSLGLQMMVGLYGDTVDTVFDTAEQLIALKPDTVRIYPTVVLKGTKLAQWYQQGIYDIMSLEKATMICSKLLLWFNQNKIKVIKFGLHASDEVEHQMIAGIYHPAFRELCENKVYFQLVFDWLKQQDSHNIVVAVHPKHISKMVGQHKSNLTAFENMGYHIKVVSDERLSEFQVECRSV